MKSVQADAPTLAALGGRAADTIRRGNTVWMNISVGHMPGEELAPDRVGQPSIFECQGDDSLTPSQFEAMRPGDMLLTQRVADTTLEARDERGAYVVPSKPPLADAYEKGLLKTQNILKLDYATYRQLVARWCGEGAPYLASRGS